MSQFTYAKISQYSDDVVKQIDIKKGKIQAINGQTYTIDRGTKSTFAKFKEESIKDTLMDMAIYSLITIILYEEEMFNEHVKEFEKNKAWHSLYSDVSYRYKY